MTKITDLTALTTPSESDIFYVVDVSDTTESAAGTSKKITRDDILNSPILIQLETFENIKFLDPSKGIALGNENYVDGAGIRFPATQSASTDPNTLDDYEEGTWTPVISGSSTAGTGTYTAQHGHYTKIGRLIVFSFYVHVTAHTGTGDIRMTGLPFTNWNNSTNGTINNYYMGFNLALAANTYFQSFAIGSSGTTMFFYETPLGPTAGGADQVNIDPACIIAGTGHYYEA